jgi:hypothetical protein
LEEDEPSIKDYAVALSKLGYNTFIADIYGESYQRQCRKQLKVLVIIKQ